MSNFHQDNFAFKLAQPPPLVAFIVFKFKNCAAFADRIPLWQHVIMGLLSFFTSSNLVCNSSIGILMALSIWPLSHSFLVRTSRITAPLFKKLSTCLFLLPKIKSKNPIPIIFYLQF